MLKTGFYFGFLAIYEECMLFQASLEWICYCIADHCYAEPSFIYNSVGHIVIFSKKLRGIYLGQYLSSWSMEC